MGRIEAIERSNHVWLTARAKIRRALASTVCVYSDFKLYKPRPLMLPIDPLSCQFFTGINSILFTHIAYVEYQSTKVFDPRFLSYEECKNEGFWVKKGSTAHSCLRVIKRVRKERVCEDSGELVTTFGHLENPYRSYYNYFHVSELSNRPIPSNAGLIDAIVHPFPNAQALDSLIGDMVHCHPVDVVFHRENDIETYNLSQHRVDVSAPDQFDSLTSFHQVLIPLLIRSCQKALGWGERLTSAIQLIGYHMFYETVMLSSDFGDANFAINEFQELSDDELVFACLYAEQAVRYLLGATRSALLVKHYREMVAAKLRMDFVMFSRNDYSESIDTGEIAMQFSESNTLTF